MAVTADPDAPKAASMPLLDPILGGTLALLTHYARMPDLRVCEHIACNLALIARHPDASEALRSACADLFTAWLGPLEVQDAPAGREWRDVWSMPTTAQ